ncbi:hypothetical protein A2886_00530 [candidate division WWE3 bacterium RIFCSPHIGHO2_01_FULL_42_13]|uniref:Ribulose-phosphate 3-epimerase n=1 Tax=candidate division WWE3 bacterium RIFCSPHIGHO2_01_FULL_42_13 TaxID=1802617 RepID=A0A1F4US43_UNCKA|nr:MAG: hypothetical protein A2886_00530 [candidate division WWE3 bacterium RIFCSPHIGHO2_01_FULL_42_13]
MIIPAITEKEFEEVRRKVGIVEKQTQSIHIDIADGILVNGETFLDVSLLNTLATEISLELHLMVKNPSDYLSELRNIKKVITQVEGEDIMAFVTASKELGYKTGVSIAPSTSLETLNLFATNVDFVQFMTIEPGAQRRPFQELVLEKIKTFKKNYPNMSIQVDGGINSETLKKVLEVGVNDIVVGSAIFDSEDPVQTLRQLQKQVEEYKS